jgi:hypothetical protein
VVDQEGQLEPVQFVKLGKGVFVVCRSHSIGGINNFDIIQILRSTEKTKLVFVFFFFSKFPWQCRQRLKKEIW